MHKLLLPLFVVLVPLVVIGVAMTVQTISDKLGYTSSSASGSVASAYSPAVYAAALGMEPKQVTRIVRRLQARSDDDLRLMSQGVLDCGGDCEEVPADASKALAAVALAAHANWLQTVTIVLSSLALVVSAFAAGWTLASSRRMRRAAREADESAASPFI